MKLLILCLFLTGCANYARTYSVYYRDGKAEIGGSLKLEPRGFKK